MNLPPEGYVDLMPGDADLHVKLGRASWAAARLHAGVRDAINTHRGAASNEPFTMTLGQAVATLEQLAKAAERPDQVDWAVNIGRQAVKRRNSGIHAVTYTAADGKQAIGTVDGSLSVHFQSAELREVKLRLIHVSMSLPS